MTRIKLILTTLLITTAAGAYAAPSDEIAQLLDNGDVAGAYQKGIEYSETNAGDPEFDFYFGLAAIEAGHAERAVFAFERILINQPDHYRARLELARAQFILADYQSARKNFQMVLDSDPPPNVRQRIKLFMDKIDDKIRWANSRVSGFAEVSIGSDSNVNSATSDATIDVPALGQVTLDETSQDIRDEYSTVNAGIDWRYLFSKVTGSTLSAAIKDQNNFSHEEYDTTAYSIRAALTHIAGDNRFELPVQYQVLDLANNTFRRMSTLSGEWTHTVTSNDQFSLYAQYGTLTYPDQKERDVDLTLGGGAWMHAFSGTQITALGSVYYGNEDTVEPDTEYNARRYYGLRIGSQWGLSPAHKLNFMAGAQKVDHVDDHPVFLEERADDFYQAAIGWSWQMKKRLTMKTTIEYYDNQSNFSLYSYNRGVADITLHYGFN